MNILHNRRAILLATLLSSGVSATDFGQTYPNIEGETLLEDERVKVQRFVLQPGQWEGIHAHPKNQLVIVVRSSDEVTTRFSDKETVFSGGPAGMSAFWRPGPVEISEQHESGNTGSTPLEWIAITFKSESIATDNLSRVVRLRDERAAR